MGNIGKQWRHNQHMMGLSHNKQEGNLNRNGGIDQPVGNESKPNQLNSEVGLTPYNSPGALCLLAGTDLTDGVWYPMGGRVWRGWKGSLRQKGAGNSKKVYVKDKPLNYVLFCVDHIHTRKHMFNIHMRCAT